MTSNTALIEVKDRGRMNGFANLFRKENHRWWGTRTWLIQTLIWVLVLDGFIASNVSRPAQAARLTGPLDMFFTLAAIGPVISVIILAQDALIDERKTGTAAWVLTKPVSRAAFLLSKLGAYALGILATMVLVPGIMAYFIYEALTGIALSVPGFLAGLGLVYLLLLYFLTLTLMLGSLSRSRGPVIGIPLALVFMANAASSPVVGLVLPWTLAMTLAPGKPSLAVTLALGEPLPGMTVILSTVVMVILFIVIALVRFEREEF